MSTLNLILQTWQLKSQTLCKICYLEWVPRVAAPFSYCINIHLQPVPTVCTARKYARKYAAALLLLKPWFC